jgi:ABC-type transporter Mla MlaB component
MVAAARRHARRASGIQPAIEDDLRVHLQGAMLRVTPRPQRGSVECLALEGRLTRDRLPRFEETCREVLARGVALELDLSGVRFVDPHGAAALQALRREGVALVGASGFLDVLLADA